MNQKPTPGRIVHYVLPACSERVGEHRAAIVTSDFGGTVVNLNVHLDQRNDLPDQTQGAGVEKCGAFLARAWSACYSETMEPGTWHWPER